MSGAPVVPRILLTGATGYIGGRLLRRLERRGTPVRCLVRHPERLCARAAASTEIVRGDLLERDGLERALAGVRTAYYLAHSMASEGSFEEEEETAARNFAAAARSRGVEHIIYLGGLGGAEAGLSSHLKSRHRVGECLRASGIRVTEFRAGVVIGSGSLSFEMVRALCERLPVMVTPRWVTVPTQPIAIDDLLAYLVSASETPEPAGGIVEIGCPDQVSYAQMVREYARQRGLRRLMIPAPLLTPRLSGLWLGLVTPLRARVGRRLIEGLRIPAVVRDPEPARGYPVEPRGFRQAIADALRNEDREFAETRWCDALSSSSSRTFGGERFGSRLVDSREIVVDVPPSAAFACIRRIGGANGWYYGNDLWRLRGLLDLMVGGPGLRRGRRDPEHLAVGDVVDCWRVEAIEPDRRLLLHAEMRLPGRAWLEFEVARRHGGAIVRQTALFDPLGLSGLAYWYGIYPLHQMVFAGMLEGLAGAARAEAARPGPAEDQRQA